MYSIHGIRRSHGHVPARLVFLCAVCMLSPPVCGFFFQYSDFLPQPNDIGDQDQVKWRLECVLTLLVYLFQLKYKCLKTPFDWNFPVHLSSTKSRGHDQQLIGRGLSPSLVHVLLFSMPCTRVTSSRFFLSKHENADSLKGLTNNQLSTVYLRH